MRIVPVVGVLVGLSFSACRGGGGTNNPNPDGPQGGSDSGSAAIHIQDIQSDAMAPGTPVELRGVIVTAIDGYGNRKNDIWVQEPGGGPLSGVHVFNVPAAQATLLTTGDIVTITGGIKQEFTAVQGGRTVTEVGPPFGGGAMLQVTKTGTGAVPAPAVVDALAIGQKATQDERFAEWEKWEGVLITVTNIRQFNEASQVPSTNNPDPTLQLFSVTGEMFLESGLAAFPAAGLGTGTCIASATGPLDYIVNWFVLHRNASDLVLGGTGCAPNEDNATVCTDAIDNDGNGFKDCVDNRCVLGHSGCRTLTSIEALQAALPTGPIELKDVFVTGVARNKKSFWISTGLDATTKNGVFVFRGNNAPDLDAAIVPGAKVSVIGTVFEFNDDANGRSLTEVSPLLITVAPDSPVPPVPPTPITTVTATDLLVPATAPDYESVLVTLTDVAITAAGATANGNIATAKQNGTTFGLGPEIVQVTSAELGCYASLTGFWTSLQAVGSTAPTKPNAFGFIPMSPLGPTSTNCQ